MDLEAVATALAPRLIGYVLARTGCRGTAEDIAQDALTALVRRWRQIGPPESPDAFAFAIARRRAGRAVARRALLAPIDAWVNSDRFNIIAKGDVGQSPAFPVQLAEGPSRLQLMMQAFLAERFKLVVRKESKESNVYALIPASSDGRLGPALRRSDVDCAALAAAARAAASSALPVQPEQARATRCRLSRGLGAIAIDGRPLVQLASSLSNIVGRRVVDRTGLSGNFDVDLTWTPDQMPPSFPRSDEHATASSDGPSIFTAIREQLGLKLVAQTRPDDVLVIERAERPALNQSANARGNGRSMVGPSVLGPTVGGHIRNQVIPSIRPREIERQRR